MPREIKDMYTYIYIYIYIVYLFIHNYYVYCDVSLTISLSLQFITSDAPDLGGARERRRVTITWHDLD